MNSPEETRHLLQSLSRSKDGASQAKSQSRRWRGVLVIGVVVVVVFFFGYKNWLAGLISAPPNVATAVGKGGANTAVGEAAPTVGVGDGGTRIAASGYIVASRRATVAAEVIGRILSIEVNEGDSVHAGQIIAKLDDAIARSDLRHAQRQVATARLSTLAARQHLEQAKRVLRQTRALFDKGFVSDAEVTRVDSAAQTLDIEMQKAAAEEEVAQANVQRYEVLLAKHVIRAPFSGIVVDRSAQPGEVISPSSAGGGYTRTGLCTIIDATSVQIEVDINESQIGYVKIGQPVDVTLPILGTWPVPARVVSIVPIASREKAALRVVIVFDKIEPSYLPNLSAKVLFKSNR